VSPPEERLRGEENEAPYHPHSILPNHGGEVKKARENIGDCYISQPITPLRNKPSAIMNIRNLKSPPFASALFYCN
jgi:hypothetical protein